METDSLAYRLQLIQPVLLRFLKEKKEIEDSAKRDGKIPEELCKLCSDSDSVNATKLHANVNSGSVNSLRSISREERKKEAGKPLYLIRYE